jgi:hypothetical protein
MTRPRRLLIAALALAIVLLLAWPASRRVRRERALEPVAAWVGVEHAVSGTAEVGLLDLPAGEDFTLHAVLEARRDGRRLFFTEAERVLIEGEELGGEQLRPWEYDGLQARVLWFTVEPQAPVVHGGDEVAQLRYRSNFRADWPRAWRVPGRLDAYRRRLTAGDEDLAGRFGTQRFQVRIELFGRGSSIRPEHRVTSAGPEDLLAAAGPFAGAVATLPGVLGPASRVFGLPQVVGELGAEPARLAARWHEEALAFTLPLLLREMAKVADRPWKELRWRVVDLADGPAWGDGGVAAGDLVRVGNRVVALYRDDGAAGRLDGRDLCFDYLDGASVERLEAVFAGEGLVEWASWTSGVAP